MVTRKPAHPRDVPDEYVMRPFDVRLSYLGKPWCTVPLEVGHDEVGDADEADWVELSDAGEAFSRLGFPTPGRVPLMRLEHQIAQKLHAVTGEGDRVRDLVDLQLIFENSEVDLAATRRVCERLFAYRNAQPWPPTVSARDGWEEQYLALADGLHVRGDLNEALAWANGLIASICES